MKRGRSGEEELKKRCELFVCIMRCDKGDDHFGRIDQMVKQINASVMD
ncbi:hypothetical protein [Candidatus Weimeria sp. HCP3S3_B5]